MEAQIIQKDIHRHGPFESKNNAQGFRGKCDANTFSSQSKGGKAHWNDYGEH